jgi:hypothetical protein
MSPTHPIEGDDSEKSSGDSDAHGSDTKRRRDVDRVGASPISFG